MTRPAPTIEVLLATYNGERYLQEQIDSVLVQTYPNVHILARDDGSRDRTSEILRSNAERFPDRFCILPTGQRSGSAQANFLHLLSISTAPYIAFCDQDDLWIPEKLSLSYAAMDRLEAKRGSNTPLLVFTDLELVDEELRTTHASFWQYEGIRPDTIHNLRLLLGKNVVTGSTALLNRPMANLARRMPRNVVMHDRWIALLANLFGDAIWLPQKTVKYRQHQGNVIGAVAQASITTPPPWRDHTERAKVWFENQKQAADMLRIHGPELSPAAHELLESYLRCGQQDSPFGRVLQMLVHRFFVTDLRSTLSILWYLAQTNYVKPPVHVGP